MEHQQARLSMDAIEKRFGPTRALKNATLNLVPGEVHALLGENGSGKSTLVKIIGGVHRPDAGTLTIHGSNVTLPNPRSAIDQRVATVFQEVLTAGSQSVLENIWLGSGGLFRRSANPSEARAIAGDVLGRLCDNISLDIAADQLSLSDRQAITITRALIRNPRVLVLDESTAALDLKTRDRLFEEVRRLTARGSSVLFISHRMDEVMDIADRVTVLRSGETVSTHLTSETTIHELIQEMSGHAEVANTRSGPRDAGEIVLKAQSIQLAPEAEPFDFELRAGELIGLGGLDGHGQDRFIRRLSGLDDGRGTISAKGQKIAYLPKERRGESLFEQMSIRENFGLPTLSNDRSGPFLNHSRLTKRFNDFAESMSIRFGKVDDPISTLSGGNQQKIVLARWLATMPDILLLNDPTRGVDIGTKRQIYMTLDKLCQTGVAIVCLSTEVEELLEITDRVLVFRDQSLSTTVPFERFDRQSMIGAYFGQATVPS